MKTLARTTQSLAEGLIIENGQLLPTPALLDGLRLAEQLQNDLNEFYGSIKTFLEVNNCKGGSWEGGYVKLSPSRRLSVSKETKPRFLVSAPNTEMIRAYQKMHGGSLPAGVTEKTSVRLIKKVSA